MSYRLREFEFRQWLDIAAHRMFAEYIAALLSTADPFAKSIVAKSFQPVAFVSSYAFLTTVVINLENEIDQLE